LPVWQHNPLLTRRLKNEQSQVYRRIINDEPARSVLVVHQQHAHDFIFQTLREQCSNTREETFMTLSFVTTIKPQLIDILWTLTK
jgi:hypothetical protein